MCPAGGFPRRVQDDKREEDAFLVLRRVDGLRPFPGGQRVLESLVPRVDQPSFHLAIGILPFRCVSNVPLQVAVASVWVDEWLGYVAPVVCVLPFLYYVVHLVIGKRENTLFEASLALTLDGAWDGLSFAWKLHWKALYSPEAWTDAVSHAVFVFK